MGLENLVNEVERLKFQNLYAQATLLARKNNQTVGDKNDYYITLEQLQVLIQQHLED